MGLSSLSEFYKLPQVDQDEAIVLWREEQERCPHCGNPRDHCSDPERVWYPQRAVCFPSMQLESAKKRYADLHKDQPWHNGAFTKWSAERTDECRFHVDWGVAPYMSAVDVDPGDLFTTHVNAQPAALRPKDEGVTDGPRP